MTSQPVVPPDEPPPTRRPFQFSLRQLLGFILFVALLLGFHVWWYPYSGFGACYLLLSLPVSLVFFRPRPGRPFRFKECLVANAIAYLAATMLMSGCVDPSGPWRRSECANHLKCIAIALHAYHERYGSFPPAYVADAQGRPMHSWRVLLLPFLEQKALYQQYDFEEPWDGPHNRQLAEALFRVYQSPEAAVDTMMTNYVAVVGPATAWPGSVGRKLSEFSDGTAQTILVVEVANSGIQWMEPRDLEFSTMPMVVEAEKGRGISSYHQDDSWWHRFVGAHVALADGRVICLGPQTPAETLRALLTVAGGEAVELPE